MDLQEVDKLILKFKKRKQSKFTKNEEINKNDFEQKSNIKFDNNKNIAPINNNKEQYINYEKTNNKINLEKNILLNKKTDIKENISLFGNIYNSFSNNLSINSKENVFDSNILENYFKELDLNYEESKERRDKIISNKINKQEKENKMQLKNVSINNNKLSKNKNYFDFNKNYIIEYSNEENKIILEKYYSSLFKESDFYLYNNYTPVSYETDNIEIKKYYDLLSILIDKNSINEPIGYIAALLIQEILLNNIELDKINIIKNSDLLNKIFKILLNSIKNKNHSQPQLFLNTKKIIDILNTQNNQIINYNLLSQEQSNNSPLDFVINLFSNNILNKNNSLIYFYFIVLNLNEKNIKDNSENIINNFDICLYIILKFFNNDELRIKNICELILKYSYQKMNFCQYIILKIILENHDIFNEKSYAKMFTSFLNFCSFEKLLIADCYNLILFTINSEVKKIFAKCSILIKYKYSLLKEKYRLDENDLLLKNKIIDNIIQFGSIHKNKFFEQYLINEFCQEKNIIKKENNKNNENIIIINEEDEKENQIENSKNQNENEKNINVNNSKNNNGFFSSIKFAFGFGNSAKNNNN